MALERPRDLSFDEVDRRLAARNTDDGIDYPPDTRPRAPAQEEGARGAEPPPTARASVYRPGMPGMPGTPWVTGPVTGPIGGGPDTAAELKKKVARVPLDLVCPVGVIYEAQAMREGYLKYGYASFLNPEVTMTARGCLSAALRHIERLLAGEDYAPEPNGTHHAGHARAMLGIYLECMEAGMLIDDRQHPLKEGPGYVGTLMDRLAKSNAG